MVEHMFDIRQPVPPENPSKFSRETTKQLGGIRRLTGMIPTIRPIALSAARSLAMVAIAMLLVLVLLPAAIAAQAASG
jgi:hypothetical protein